MIRRIAIGLVLALLLALPATAQSAWHGWKEMDTGMQLIIIAIWVFWAAIILGIPALAIASDESNRCSGRRSSCWMPSRDRRPGGSGPSRH